MSETAVLDHATLERLRELNEEGEPDLVEEVLTLFLGDAPARVAAISATLAAGDAQGLARSAHGLKGAAGNIGAHRLQAACEEVEQLGARGHAAEAAPGVETLREEFDAVRREIARMLQV